MSLVRALVRGLPAFSLLVAACAPSSDAPLAVRQAQTRSAALEAYCSVNVQGSGAVDVESDYLPHVVACENGAADDEALRAQAVAARSYVYYKLSHPESDGTITDGQGDQVYTCNNQPSQRHYDAVATTAGEILRFPNADDELVNVAAFYVAGSIPSTDDCVAAAGDNDYSDTEKWVTYNWGAAGAGLEQTMLGFVSPTNYQNRGCQSQNGADCLSENGWGYEDILRFYYGMDIEHVVAEGACVVPTGLPHGCGLVVDDVETVFDDSGACFLRGCASGPAWEERADGVSGGSLVTGGYDSAERDCFGRWQLSFAAAGEYVVEVHVPEVAPRVSEASYLVRHAALDTAVVVAQADVAGWVSLGSFAFAAGSFQFVELDDTAPEDGTLADGPYVVYDAVRVRPVGLSPSDAGVPLEDAGAPLQDAGAADSGGDEDDDSGMADEGNGDGGVGSDDEAGFTDLPPSVVYECACVATRPLAPAGSLLGLMLAAGIFVVRRRPNRAR